MRPACEDGVYESGFEIAGVGGDECVGRGGGAGVGDGGVETGDSAWGGDADGFGLGGVLLVGAIAGGWGWVGRSIATRIVWVVGGL